MKNYKVLRIKSPIARKDYICEICGKLIRRGERYQCGTIVSDGKVRTMRRHLDCHNNRKTCDELDFRKEVKVDMRTLVDKFSFRENMQIVFFPMVLSELSWHFASRVVDIAVERRISSIKRISRRVRELRREYESNCRKDLKEATFEHMVDSTYKFMDKFTKDFTLLYYTSCNELQHQRNDVMDIDMRSYAYMSLVMIDTLRLHNANTDVMISKRLGGESRLMASILPKSIRDLESCMLECISPLRYVRSIHVNNTKKIIINNIKKCDFVLTNDK